MSEPHVHDGETRTDGPAGTAALARVLAPRLAPGDVVLLVGGLGTGKTTFVQAVAEALGAREPVTSPTFTLANFYETRAGRVLHVDTYRLEDRAEFDDLGLTEFTDECVTFVEWGALVAEDFPDALRIDLAVAPDDDAARYVVVTATAERWRPVVDELAGVAPARDGSTT